MRLGCGGGLDHASRVSGVRGKGSSLARKGARTGGLPGGELEGRWLKERRSLLKWKSILRRKLQKSFAGLTKRRTTFMGHIRGGGLAKGDISEKNDKRQGDRE